MSALDKLRAIPSVDAVLNAPSARDALSRFSRELTKANVREVLEQLRLRIASDGNEELPSIESVVAAAVQRLEAATRARMRRVINATGVVLHTNLGRAVLSPAATQAVVRAASGAVNLELDLETGERGRRDALVAGDLCALTGAEAATVVNNNAAAVLLALNTIAAGREVVVSRGELIEIGGSFRIPDVLAKSGARLHEVGTTNRTHPRDYAGAVGPATAALLKVHTSNYRIVGFSSEVSLAELVRIGRECNVPVIEDLGSGALIDLSVHGLPKEPVVAERIGAGADLVCFSGDKLLGGPQAGIIVGRRDLIERIDANPLKRALRCDKLTLAALAATLGVYRASPDLRRDLPVLATLTRGVDELQAIGEAAVALLRPALGSEFTIALIDSSAEIGSGALPIEALPSKAIAIEHPLQSEDEIAERFRRADPPIIGRIHDGRFLLDLRAIGDPRDLVPNLT